MLVSLPYEYVAMLVLSGRGNPLDDTHLLVLATGRKNTPDTFPRRQTSLLQPIVQTPWRLVASLPS